MKSFLMYRDRDFQLPGEMPPNADELVADLELEVLFAAMAGGDRFLYEVAKPAVLASLQDPEAIVYRQGILTDCLGHPDVIRAMYDVAEEGVNAERRAYRSLFSRSPDAILHSAVQVLELLVAGLRRLRQIADEHAGEFSSGGFTRLFAMLRDELSDDYFAAVADHLRRLRFRNGMAISARLGKGNRGTDHVLRRPADDRKSWLQRVLGRGEPEYSFEIADRDESGLRALAELRSRGLNLVANALAQSTDHVQAFFQMLRAELGFYVGCLNLHDRLAAVGAPVSIPVPAVGGAALSAQGLYDPCLALQAESMVVGNELAADTKALTIVTGANQGGKSTFLRSVGLAHLMLQAGMFVAAERFRASVSRGLFTHFKREEDPSMQSGKLDEEMARMGRIVERIEPGCVLLCNESFASTNEREGSEIARQIVRALTEGGVRVVYVTHLFDLAEGFHRQGREDFLFLRAERTADGRRTFRVVPAEPLATSYGRDLYEQVFGVEGGRADRVEVRPPEAGH